MKKTLNINLGGMAFIIDENAFELLHSYLEALKSKFKNDAGRDEILNDIEARIGEMLSQKLGRKEVVSVEDVQYVMGVMGKPEDIAGEEPETTAQTITGTGSQPNTAARGPVRRRLFRDPDDAVVGGVISGLCHYFGINDPVWMRIAVGLLLFPSFFTVALVYILLLIIVPKAMTSSEKLQMKGEPVNISTIEKEIKGAAVRAGESVNNLVKEGSGFSRLGHLLVSAIVLLLKICAGVIIFVCSVVLAFLIAWMFRFHVAGSESFEQAINLLTDNAASVTVFNIGLLLFVGAPVIAVIYLALRAILGPRGKARWLMWTLLAAWWAGLFLLGYAVIENIGNFKTTGTQREQTALMQPAGEHIYVQLTDSAGNKLSTDDDDDQDIDVTLSGVFINGEDLRDVSRINIGKPHLQLMPSPNDSFYVEKIISSQGKSKSDAQKNAGYVTYAFSQKDSVLNLAGNLFLDKKNKYRFQDMKLRIAIPEGKQVSFADNIDRWTAVVKGDNNYDDTYFANTTWSVKDGKVICLKGENHRDAEEEIEIERKKAKKEKRKGR